MSQVETTGKIPTASGLLAAIGVLVAFFINLYGGVGIVVIAILIGIASRAARACRHVPGKHAAGMSADCRWFWPSARKGSTATTRSRGWARVIDGRLLLAAAAIGFLGVMAALSPDARYATWRALGVPTLQPEFADARVITTGWDCTQAGYDVLRENPCDPWQRPMNYPRLWTLPAALGLGEAATAPLALTFAALFLAALLRLVGRIGRREAAVYLAAVASPSVLLALERGNNDLAVFALVVAGGPVAILAGTVVKLYPLAAIVALRTWRARLAVGAVAAVYGALTLHDIGLVFAATPHYAEWSYGLSSTALVFSVPAWTIAALILVAVAVIGRMARPIEAPSFTAGAAIYLATYVAGPSWDYRLIFVLLTFPALIELARGGRFALLAIALGALWLSTGGTSPLFVADQIAKLLLAIGYAGLLAARVSLEVPSRRSRQRDHADTRPRPSRGHHRRK